MKRLLCLSTALVLGACSTQTSHKPDLTAQKAKAIPYKYPDIWRIEELSKKSAENYGDKLAKVDYKNRHYQVFISGSDAFSTESPYSRWVRKRYGVRSEPIASCVISPQLSAFKEAYNAAMEQLLIKHFGKDIFAEAGRRWFL